MRKEDPIMYFHAKSRYHYVPLTRIYDVINKCINTSIKYKKDSLQGEEKEINLKKVLLTSVQTLENFVKSLIFMSHLYTLQKYVTKFRVYRNFL